MSLIHFLYFLTGAVEYPKNICKYTDKIHGYVLKKLEAGNYVGAAFGCNFGRCNKHFYVRQKGFKLMMQKNSSLTNINNEFYPYGNK